MTTYRTELTPLAFLERSADVFAGKTAISYGDRSWTYAEMATLTTRFANALRASGVDAGDRVAVLLPNVPEMLLAHFAVPLAGAVLVSINTRLSPEEIRYICDHSGAKVLVGDTELLPALAGVVGELETVAEVIAVDDLGLEVPYPTTPWDEFLGRGSDAALDWRVDDEEATISINYTSGTTGRPKGVMYTHRGAYLNALAEIVHSRHTPDSVYLWTLPMFHCNGWCTTWGVTAIGGRHVCLRKVEASEIWRLIDAEGVTHLNGAPTVLLMIATAEEAHPLPRPLVITTAAAPPNPKILAALEELGAQIVHVYGLTETYGPHTVCEYQPGIADAAPAERARFLARQGVAYIHADPIRVVDEDMNDVPRDGTTMGEVVMRGNNVMKGYFADPEATAEAFRGGWFHSGDLAVWHPDGYIELRDRAKDIIISGGENISTIEVEQAIGSHPAVLECTVIAIPDDTWGERPKAFVILREGAEATEEEIIAHVRERLAHFKAPDVVEFVEDLPRTSTGKIQKYVLREREWAGRDGRIHGAG
ncbi:MAG TPA: long-chain-fatty-acid--CoA ligase [Actinobacteria bacterium]|nr:long-chain-fatty-acid--CoA ligase [Actinomycetota bacterium]